jgi:hypothetical protein
VGKLGFDRLFEQFAPEDMSSPDKNGHNRSLENMKNLITIINSKELENIWSTAKKHSSTSTIRDDSISISM